MPNKTKVQRERKQMKGIQLGKVFIEYPLALGPMAGVTDLPFRLLCREQGAGLVYTEMVSAKAILYRNKNTGELMRIHPAERPIALQLFGSEPESVAEAAARIEDKPFDILDFNMGCPVPKVVNNGEGSALMKNPELAADIIRAVVRKIHKPVSVKIRRGFDLEHCTAVEVAKRLEDAGTSLIAVHGRTRSQFYSGQADWDCIRRVKEAVSIPVLGNGDVDSPYAAEKMLQETGADGIMIARAAEGNPWIFRDVRTFLETREIPAPPSLTEKYGLILRHLSLMEEYKGEYTAVHEMRKHAAWYTSGMPNSASFRRQVNQCESGEELRSLLHTIFLQPSGKQL